MIIHICGASGSGKSFLGLRLKKVLKNVKIYDMDNIRDSFLKQYSQVVTKDYQWLYQDYLDRFIKKVHKNCDVIIVGLNANIVGECHIFTDKHGGERVMEYPNHCYEIYADHKFYIDLEQSVVIRQRFMRDFDYNIEDFFKILSQRKVSIFESLVKDEDDTSKRLCETMKMFINISSFKTETEKWDKFYRDQGYNFKSPDDIYNECIKLIKAKKKNKN